MLPNCNAYDLILVQNEKKGEYSISGSLYDFGGSSTAVLDECTSIDLLVVGSSRAGGGGESLQIQINEMQDKLPQIAAQLQPGQNKARFLLKKRGKIIGIAACNVFLWSTTDKIVVVDVDGTITTSTMTGFLRTAVFGDYGAGNCHDGVCEFLSSIPSVQTLYLTNRPISYADNTRSLLSELRQESHALPSGPLIGFMGSLAGVFHMDLCAQNAHEFKFDTLYKYVAKPFAAVNANASDVFYAGFGNTLYDMHAYHKTGIRLNRMFVIDKTSTIYCLNKSEHERDDDNKDTEAAVLKHPKEYAAVKGTRFDGYQDEKLLSHVLGYKKI